MSMSKRSFNYFLTAVFMLLLCGGLQRNMFELIW
jgi:hypothetical protein